MRGLASIFYFLLSIYAVSWAGCSYERQDSDQAQHAQVRVVQTVQAYRAERARAVDVLLEGGDVNHRAAFEIYRELVDGLPELIERTEGQQRVFLQKELQDLKQLLPVLEVMLPFQILRDVANPSNNVMPMLEAILIVSSYQNVTPGGRYIEMGAGLGPMAVAAALNGAGHITVSDYNELAVRGLKLNFDALQQRINTEGTRDFVTLSETQKRNLEHVFGQGRYEAIQSDFFSRVDATRGFDDIAADMPQSPGSGTDLARAGGAYGTEMTIRVIQDARKYFKEANPKARLHLINFAYAAPRQIDDALRNAQYQIEPKSGAESVWVIERPLEWWGPKKINNWLRIKELVSAGQIDIGADPIRLESTQYDAVPEPAYVKVRLLTSLLRSACTAR